MKIQLSDHFTYRKLLRFVLPSIAMMICTSLYSIVDGFFVSNFAGKTPFAAVNLIMPVTMAAGTIGFMIGTGGSAIVSMTLGQGRRDLANRYFSMLIYAAIIGSLILSVLGFLFIRPMASALGADGEMLEYCVVYGRILFLALTAFVLQNIFQSFFVTAEKPGLSLAVAVISGLTNMVFDFIFIALFHWGIAGAAIATAMGQIIGGIIPLIYFSRDNGSLLRLTRTRIEGRILRKTCINGSSEMVTNLSASVVNILYNLQLMKLAGEDGIAAYGVIMYANFVFSAIFFGYSIGSAPVIGFHYGASNHGELQSLFKKSLILTGSSSLILTAAAELLSSPLIRIFVGYDAGLYQMTCHGFRLYSFMFLITGFNIWGSSFFTALGNGFVSAVISFLRTLVFQVAVILILPLLLGLDGVWLGVVAAEVLSLAVTAFFFVNQRNKYHYA